MKMYIFYVLISIAIVVGYVHFSENTLMAKTELKQFTTFHGDKDTQHYIIVDRFIDTELNVACYRWSQITSCIQLSE